MLILLDEGTIWGSFVGDEWCWALPEELRAPLKADFGYGRNV